MSRSDPPDPDPTVARRSVLAGREFQALLVGRSINALAISALVTVVAFQVYDITRDPLALGWLGLVEAIPALSLVLFGGHVADRRDRRAVVLVTGAAVTVCAVLLAFIAASPAWTSLAAILAVVFATGVANGFERPALSGLEAQVIPLDRAVEGVSWTSGGWQLGGIVGPAAGGISIALLGVATTYGLIAGLLAIATAAILLIAPKPIPAVVRGESFLATLLGGFRYVRRTPALLGCMALDLFAVFFGGAIALLPVFASDVLHVGPIGLGLLRTAPSAGALLVTLVATRRPPGRHAGRTLLLCVAGFGLSMIVFGLSTSFVLSLAALFLSGVTDGVSVIIRWTILRVLSPEALRGRVAAVNWVFVGASNELGAFESGVAARLFGPVATVVGGGVLTLGIVGLVAAIVPGLRRFDLVDATATGPTQEPDHEPTSAVA
ncbi:MAG: MFS transporter [Chloroflexota bacterium]